MTVKERQAQIKIVSTNKQRYFYNLVNKDFLLEEVEKTKTNYKIAILISGGLRNFDTTQEWVNKFLIEPLNADTFVFGWQSKNGIKNDIEVCEKYKNIKKYQVNNREELILPVPIDMHDKYPDHYNRGWGLEVADHIVCQLFNIHSCFKLIEEYEIENNFHYDIIIRIRPDEFWFDKIDDADLNFTYNNRCLATPQHYISTISGDKINDRFAMGTRDVMKEYCNMYNYVEEYAKYAGNDEATEFYTNYHIRNTMQIVLYNIDIKFMLEYPGDFIFDNGFDSTTQRHLTQNDSNVAISVANSIKNRN